MNWTSLTLVLKTDGYRKALEAEARGNVVVLALCLEIPYRVRAHIGGACRGLTRIGLQHPVSISRNKALPLETSCYIWSSEKSYRRSGTDLSMRRNRDMISISISISISFLRPARGKE